MLIFELETEDGINELLEETENVRSIRDSLAEHRDKYREFSTGVEIEFRSLEKCCKSFEKNLLIDIYTFSEQLFKNFYYEMIEKDRHENMCVNNYMNCKLDPEKFSPNVKYKLIQSSISKELITDFKFLLSDQVEEIRKYNNLIATRHHYAHKGAYGYEFDDFKDVILVEKYLVLELEMIVRNKDERQNFYDDFMELKRMCCNIKKKMLIYNNCNGTELKNVIRNEIRGLRDLSQKVILNYNKSPLESELLETLKEKIVSVISVDLRKYDDSCLIVDDLYYALLDKQMISPVKEN